MTKKNLSNKFCILLILTIFLNCMHHHHRHHGKSNKFMHKKTTSELINSFESEERDSYQEPAKVLGFIGPLEGTRILDIGSGSGYFSFKLALKGANVISADVNDEFLAHINKRLQTEPVKPGSIVTRKIQFDNPTLKPEEVDKVLMVNVYHHIAHRVPYMKLVRSGLKKDGELILVDFTKKKIPVGPPEDHKISAADVKLELERSGFSSIEVNESLLKYQYVIRAK